VDDTGGMHIFETALDESVDGYQEIKYCATYQDLVEKILDELLFQGPRGEQTM
jgi:hypothetical protein